MLHCVHYGAMGGRGKHRRGEAAISHLLIYLAELFTDQGDIHITLV